MGVCLPHDTDATPVLGVAVVIGAPKVYLGDSSIAVVHVALNGVWSSQLMLSDFSPTVRIGATISCLFLVGI